MWHFKSKDGEFEVHGTRQDMWLGLVTVMTIMRK